MWSGLKNENKWRKKLPHRSHARSLFSSCYGALNQCCVSALVSMRIQLFRLMRIRIQGFDDRKSKIIYSWQNGLFWSKIAIYLSLGLHKGRLKIQDKSSSSKDNIQHFKTWNFFTFVGHLNIFALLDPDLHSHSTNQNECGSVRTRIHITALNVV